MKIKIKVVPRSLKEEVIKQGEEYTVRVKDPPREGKANEAVIRVIAIYFKVPRGSVKIVSGLTGKHKIVEIGAG